MSDGFTPVRPGIYASVLQDAGSSLYATWFQYVSSGHDLDAIAGRVLAGLGLRSTYIGSGALAALVSKWDADAGLIDTNDADAVNRHVRAAEEIANGIRAEMGYGEKLTLTSAVVQVAADTKRDLGNLARDATPWALIFLLVVLLIEVPETRKVLP